MAEKYSDIGLYEALASGGEARDAILNPTTNTETFLNTVASDGFGAVSNLSNLIGNLISVPLEQRDSEAYKRTKRILKDTSKPKAERVLDLLKVPFGETRYDPIDVIYGEGASAKVNEEFEQERADIKHKQSLAKQYAGGGAGELLGEAFMATPIMKAGSMRTTTNALKLGLSKVDIAKSITIDSVRNAGVFGSTEFGLAKAYGKSDEEAIGNALSASVLGLAGSPLLGSGKGFAHWLGSEERAMRANFEAGGSRAGGGKPLEADDPDLAYREPRTPKTEAQKSKEEVEKTLYEAVEPRVDSGEILKGQTFVPEVNNPKKTGYKLQQTGRLGIAESHLGSHQGGATQKASFKVMEKEPILDAKAEVDKLVKVYDNEQALREAYGQTQAKFKGKKELLKADKLRLRNKFKIDQYKAIAKDSNVNDTVRKQARDKALELRKRKFDEPFVSETTVEKATKKFEDQYLFHSSKSAKKRSSDLKTEYEAFLSKQEHGADEAMKVSSHDLVKAVTSKQDKGKAIKAIKALEIKELGKKFKATDITPEQRKKYPNEVADIENYIFSKMDVNDFKQGKITAEELRYRERRRLEEALVREMKIEKDGKVPTEEELLKADEAITKDFEAIGLARKSKGFESKTKQSSKSKSKKKFVDKNKAERERKEIESSVASRNIMLEAMKAYKKNRVIFRRGKTGGRAGQPVLSKTTMREIQEGVLTVDEILNKTNPIGIKADIEELREVAKAQANNKIYAHHQSKLGIKPGKRFKEPEDIVFKDEIIDASNSMGQLMAVLLGSKRLWKAFPTIREDIGEAMAKMGYKIPNQGDRVLTRAEWKDMVKPVFMTKTYGQGDKGLIENIIKDEDGFYIKYFGHKPTRREATEFLDFYKKAEDKLVPEIRQFETMIDNMLKKTNKVELKWDVPNGTTVTLDITKAVDGTISIKGRNIAVQVKGQTNRGTRAVLPNIIQSLDAFAASKLSAKGIPSTFDAFQLAKGQSKEAELAYKEALTEIADGKVLQTIAKQLELDTSKLPARDLTKEEILESTKALGVEHGRGEVTTAKPRQKDLSRTLNEEEVMRDFMASGNVRQHNTNQLVDAMVNESGYRTMSVAKSNDDVFERQIAMAHQSSVYNKDMAIPAPKGVDEKVWDKVQRNIFNEARAKLEYNPMLKDVIQGQRKYVAKNGKLIGDDKMSLSELIQQEVRNNRKLKKLRNSEEQASFDTVGKDYEDIRTKVYSWSTKKNLNEDELNAKKFVFEQANHAEPQKLNRETLKGIKKYFTDQYEATKESDAFRRLSNIRKKRDREVEYHAEKVYNELNRLIKVEKADSEEWTKHLINTDFHSIRHMDKDVAKEYEKEFDYVYKQAKPYIDQHVKALNEKSQQIGYYLNNARLIADAVGLDRSHDVIIDKLISIKAMSDESWKFVEKNRGSELWDMSMNIMLENRKLAAKNFASNPEAFVKGFAKEYYGQGKQLVDRKVMWDAEDKATQGLIPIEAESKKVGKVTDETKIPYDKFKTRQELLDYALENELKVTDKGFRQVENAKLRDEAGRSKDFARILSETSHSIDKKMRDRETAMEILDELTLEDSLISSKPKSNFREITLEERDALPYSLQGKVRYVHEDYIDRIIGRRETRLVQKGRDVAGENQRWKIADRILADFVANFKQNVVLKNISSFKNAILVNQTIGAMAGVSPKKAWKFHSEALKQIRRNDNLRSKIALLKAQGKEYKHLEQRLLKSDLFQMEQLGLSLNQLDGVRGDSSLLANMLSDFTGHRFDKIANEILMNQKSHVGRFTTSLFSTIDTQGRYTVAKQFMEDGLTMQEAVNKANGLFSDMDEMAPVLVEAMDKYGAIPFLKWFTLTTPQLMKLAKDNPKKTAMLSVALYALSAETDMNFDSVNPIQAVVDFADNAVSLDYLEAVNKKGFVNPTIRKLTPYVVPNAWQDIDRVTTDVGDEYTLRPGIKRKAYNPLVKDRIGAPWSEDSLDYRGFTQKMIQGNK